MYGFLILTLLRGTLKIGIDISDLVKPKLTLYEGVLKIEEKYFRPFKLFEKWQILFQTFSKIGNDISNLLSRLFRNMK